MNHRRPERVEREAGDDGECQQAQEEGTPLRIGRKGMNRGQHPGADQEGTQQAEREGNDRQQHRPALEHTTLFGHRQRVHERSAGQPGQQGGVLHRIPEPPAAPAKFVIGPPATQGDTQGKESPRHGRPGPGPARPGGIQATVDQGSDCKGKGDGKPHITHIEHGWMNDQAEVLQQRVQIRAVCGHIGQQAVKRVRGDHDEQQEPDTDHTQH